MDKVVIPDMNTRMPASFQPEYQNITGSGFVKPDTVFHFTLLFGSAGNLNTKRAENVIDKATAIKTGDFLTPDPVGKTHQVKTQCFDFIPEIPDFIRFLPEPAGNKNKTQQKNKENQSLQYPGSLDVLFT